MPDLNDAVAAALRPAADEDMSELECVRKLGMDKTSPKAMQALLAKGDVLGKLGVVLSEAAGRFSQQRAATASELHEKFCQDESSTRMSYGGLDSFFRGLDGVIGQPATDLHAGIHREHAKSRDSQHMFEAKNYVCACVLELTSEIVSSHRPACRVPHAAGHVLDERDGILFCNRPP